MSEKHSKEGKNIKVFVRVRPFNSKESETGNCIESLTDNFMSIKER